MFWREDRRPPTLVEVFLTFLIDKTGDVSSAKVHGLQIKRFKLFGTVKVFTYFYP